MKKRIYVHNQQNRFLRKDLRNNTTKTEKILWEHLKGKRLGYKFRRQHGIGPYIVDFYCPQKSLAIEADGEYHRHQIEYDENRDKYLSSIGCVVLRFSNYDILENISCVKQDILNALEKSETRKKTNPS